MRVLALAFALALAGCAGEGEPVALESLPTGVLAGVVTDVALVPLAGVNVTVTGSDGVQNASALTDAAGAFRFVLEPGEHLVVATLEGHVPAAARASVVALATANVSLTLSAIPRVTPRVESQEGSGLLACGVVLRNGASTQEHACPAEDANARPVIDFALGGTEGLAGVVVELDWAAGSKLSERLALSVALVKGGTEEAMGHVEGRAPLSVSLPLRLLEGKDLADAAVRVRAAPAGSVADQESAMDAGATLSQPFAAYVSVFYHEEPPAGFSVLAPKASA